MIKKTIILMAVLFGSVKCENSPQAIDLVRQKWMNWANCAVYAERDAFLKQYGLDASSLVDDKHNYIDIFKSAHDQQVEAAISLLEAISLINLYEIKPDARHAISVKKIATQVFEKCSDVQIIDQPSFGIHEVCLLQHCKKNICCLVLNCKQHLENVAELEDILRHEYCHFVHQDNLNDQFIKYTALASSNVTCETVEEQKLPYYRASETRADVYAAVTSPSYGAHLISNLKKTPKIDEETLTHPKDSDRIALLEKIKSELESAQ